MFLFATAPATPEIYTLSLHDALPISARGEHDHGHVHAAAAELPADVPAAHPGHHDVEQHEVGRVAQGERDSVLAIRRRDGLVPLEAQIVLEAAHDLRLVVRDQDPSHGPPPGATG